jgi:hypothetical protein
MIAGVPMAPVAAGAAFQAKRDQPVSALANVEGVITERI